MFALGFTNYWDTYFAGRAAPLGLTPAEVVDALFYNFAPGEVARHIPKVWRTTTPEAAIAARQMGCVKALRRILGDHVDAAAFARAAGLLIKAATSAPFEGRPMYAALRRLPVPDDAVGRLFHAASLLREHRGDGHVAALMAEGVGGLEAHVLLALDMDMPANKFGRIHHLPAAQIDAVIDGMRGRGLIGNDGWLSKRGTRRQNSTESEALTDDCSPRRPTRASSRRRLPMNRHGHPRAARPAATGRPGLGLALSRGSRMAHCAGARPGQQVPTDFQHGARQQARARDHLVRPRCRRAGPG